MSAVGQIQTGLSLMSRPRPRPHSVRLSALQIALLKILTASGKPVALDVLERSVYYVAGRVKPRKHKRQSLAALVRSTSKQKCEYLGAKIVRVSLLGSGRKALYQITGDIGAVQDCIINNIECREGL